MARRSNTEDLIHCDSCGEDYSATYKSCPFCAEKYDNRPPAQSDEDDDDGYVFDGQDLFDDAPEDTQSAAAKGGKRLSGTATAARRTTEQSKSRSSGVSSINWPRLITFVCALIIIVAALVIIFTVIYPQLHSDSPSAESQPAAEQSAQPSESYPAFFNPDGSSSAPEVTPTVPAGETPLNALTMLGPTDTDFTLQVGESHTLTPGFNPADWSGTVTYTSSNTAYATVDENGKVTNVSTTTGLHRVTIVVSAGGKSVECTVYCRGVDADPSAPPVVTPTPTPGPGASTAPSTGLTVGAKGKITGAAGGLNVRSGPGTTYSVQASLVNGNEVTVLENAGGGWYKISYYGAGGVLTTGYVMGTYISTP